MSTITLFCGWRREFELERLEQSGLPNRFAQPTDYFVPRNLNAVSNVPSCRRSENAFALIALSSQVGMRYSTPPVGLWRKLARHKRLFLRQFALKIPRKTLLGQLRKPRYSNPATWD
jgi:hypothetical protein